MKIVSDHKDYYDWVVRETDNRKVYVRKTHIVKSTEVVELYNKAFKAKYKHVGSLIAGSQVEIEGRKFFKSVIWFCDVAYRYVQDLVTKEFYYKDYELPDLYRKPLKKAPQPSKWRRRIGGYFEKDIQNDIVNWLQALDEKTQWERLFDDKIPKLNTNLGVAVVYGRLRDGYMPEDVLNGSLQDMQFNKVMKPEEAYQALYNWIPYHEPDMPSDPDDKQRLAGAGFDVKTSFRNPIRTSKNK